MQGLTFEYLKDKSCEAVVANTLQGNLMFLLKQNGPMVEEKILENLTGRG